MVPAKVKLGQAVLDLNLPLLHIIFDGLQSWLLVFQVYAAAAAQAQAQAAGGLAGVRPGFVFVPGSVRGVGRV